MNNVARNVINGDKERKEMSATVRRDLVSAAGEKSNKPHGLGLVAGRTMNIHTLKDEVLHRALFKASTVRRCPFASRLEKKLCGQALNCALTS